MLGQGGGWLICSTWQVFINYQGKNLSGIYCFQYIFRNHALDHAIQRLCSCHVHPLLVDPVWLSVGSVANGYGESGRVNVVGICKRQCALRWLTGSEQTEMVPLTEV